MRTISREWSFDMWLSFRASRNWGVFRIGLTLALVDYRTCVAGLIFVDRLRRPQI